MAQASSLANDKVARTLPEVPLRWNDFVWALERLRHKRYGKKMRERSVSVRCTPSPGYESYTCAA